MAGYIIVGTLAAFGTLCFVWVLVGWFLPVGQGCILVCRGIPDEGILLRYRWLRETGLLNCPLIAVDAVMEKNFDGMEKNFEGMEICAGEDLLARLEWERNGRNGTGTGDPSGRHQRRGISEL